MTELVGLELKSREMVCSEASSLLCRYWWYGRDRDRFKDGKKNPELVSYLVSAGSSMEVVEGSSGLAAILNRGATCGYRAKKAQ